jgi:hypothetical protein
MREFTKLTSRTIVPRLLTLRTVDVACDEGCYTLGMQLQRILKPFMRQKRQPRTRYSVFLQKSFCVFVVLLLLMPLAACSGGAVVFAPTPLPPDLSPLRYDHPSGAFSLTIPRNWSVYPQNTTILAAAAFAQPGENEPSLRVAVINLGRELDSAGLRDFMSQYQTQIRADSGRYTETDRGAMGDGSWRLAGLRRSVGNITQQVNTFIQQSDTFVSIIEVLLPDDGAAQAALQSIINSFSLNTEAGLQPTEVSALASATVNELDIVHVSTWTTPAGVFFITGEIGNYGPSWVDSVPIRAVLRTADGLGVVEASDSAMGYGIPPGGFAPFSLRFGQGQSALTSGYELYLGGEGWTMETAEPVYGQETLTWSDDSSVGADGRLTITGTITNIGTETIHDPRAVVTVFDAVGDVIAAGFSDVTPAINAGDSAAFQIVVPELGSPPVNYIVSVQALR